MPTISGIYNYLVSHVSGSEPEVAGGVDVTRRQFVTGAAAAVTTAVFDSSQGVAQVFLAQAQDDGFRAGDAARGLYGNPPGQWAAIAQEQGWNADQIGQVQNHLSHIINADHGNAKLAIGGIERAGRTSVASAQSGAARDIERAQGSVSRMIDVIDRDIGTRALNTERQTGNVPQDVQISDADQAKIDDRKADLIESDPKIKLEAREALIERFRDDALNDPAYLAEIDQFASKLARESSPEAFQRRLEVLEEEYGQPIGEIELDRRQQVRLQGALDKFERDSQTMEMPVTKEQYEQQLRVSIIGKTERGSEAILKEFRDEAAANISDKAVERVALDVARRPENLDARLQALEDAGLELSERSQGRLDQYKSSIIGNSEAGREQMRADGMDGAVDAPLSDRVVGTLQTNLDRIRTVPREQVLGEMDAQLTEKYGAETAARYMEQISPGYERQGLRLESPDADKDPKQGVDSQIDKVLDGVQASGYKDALRSAMEGGSIDRRQATSNIAEFRRELNDGMAELRAQGQAMQYQGAQPKPQSDIVPERPGGKPFMQDI